MPGSKKTGPREDPVDRVIAEWKRERPELDTTPSAAVIRIAMLAHAFGIELKGFFADHGLSRADFEVLAALRRSGKPYALPQHDIMHASRRSSGTISFRIDRLERDGYVRRKVDPADARSAIVELTQSGKEVVDRIVPAHLANQARLLGSLSKYELLELLRLLRKLTLHNL